MIQFAKNLQGKICSLLPALANRHGLITGATGTGKTISLQVLAEQFSAIGVPVFLADIKGDLGGLAAAGINSEKLQSRLDKIKVQNWKGNAFPVCFWDILGKSGHPIRATISDMGPQLIARLLDLNEVQTGVLFLVFKIADDCGQLLLDLKDLRALVQYIGENNKDFTNEYGNIAPATIGAIQRGLVALESQGADQFFGEPMFDIADLMMIDPATGRGLINILAADQLIMQPKIYATFLLWLLAELFERLPEVGDLEQPKLVFFFDEAHLLFNDAPKILLEKIEQVVRLIRSKGVGVYFVSQNPLDVPDTILAQLSNRVQHALRAFTPRDLKAVNTAADTLRANPNFSSSEVITQLAVGEALVSFLDTEGTPSIVERVFVLPPQSRIGPLNAEERQAVLEKSPYLGKYEQLIDRYSAFEMIKGIANPETNIHSDYPNTEANNTNNNIQIANETTQTIANNQENINSQEINSTNDEWGNSRGKVKNTVLAQENLRPLKSTQQQQSERMSTANNKKTSENDGIFGKIGELVTDGAGGRRESIAQAAAKSLARSVGSQIGAAVVRGVLGSILGGRRR